ncbi:MAG: hypothetical protein K6F17_01575 [Lachnospiraceae bacterium]|nr:hypothetical protein [Lachnospiraceae bacterium]
MLYITGIHALNLPCELETCGDWHTSAIQWNNPQIRESKLMFFKDYGIETNHIIPEHNGQYNVANTIRALLDLLQEGKFSIAQGMNNEYICNDKYNQEVFSLVYSMKTLNNWIDINNFMKKEYRLSWLDYLQQRGEEFEQIS